MSPRIILLAGSGKTTVGRQLAILEPPVDALELDVRQSPAELVAAIRRHSGV